jgi:hypothetical protein
MIRKQLYIDKVHEQKLKRLARERGVTEAEIVRDAIDRTEGPQSPSHFVRDPEAARRFFETIDAIARRKTVTRAPRWTRESLYEDRIRRWTKS